MGETIDSLQIYINSKYASSNPDYSGANNLYLLPYIVAPEGHYIHISVVNASIPYSFYNINELNNVLYCVVHYQFITDVMIAHDESYFINIPVGNYNANQMVNVLSKMSNWTATSDSGSYNNPNLVVTYNAIVNRFTFRNTLDLEFNFPYPNTTCIEPLGLSEILINSSSFGYEYTSKYSINLAVIRAINIVTNYSSGNLSILQQNNFNTLCSIPVTTLPNTLVYYENSNDFKTNLYLGEINNINIKLTDQDNNVLFLNGLYYNLTLQIDILRFN